MAISISRTTTNPISDAASFLIQKTGGVNDQGKGVSTDFSVDLASRAKVLNITFDYIINSGTFTAGSSTTDSDIIVYIYDKTNGVLIEPSSFKLLSNSSTIVDTFIASFQTSYNGADYRLIFHQATTTTNNFELKIDNVMVTPTSIAVGTPITDWQSYTPNVGNLVLNPTGKIDPVGYWRRVGDSVEVKVSFKNGSGGTATGTSYVGVSLPAGLIADTNKDGPPLGGHRVSGYGSLFSTISKVYFSGSTLYLWKEGVDYYSVSDITANATYSIYASIPIIGWSSSVQMSDGYDGRNVSTKMYPSANLTGLNPNASAVKLNINTAIIDKVGGANTASNRIDVKTSGVYDIKAAIELAGTNILSGGDYRIYIYKNGSAWRFGYITFPLANGNTTSLIGDFPNEELLAGDYLELYLYSGSNHSVNTLTAVGGTNMITFLSIEKLSGSPTISAQETIGALYTGAPPTGTLGAAYNTVTFGTKVKDSHGAYSGGVYTVPASGQYDVSSQVQVTATYVAGNTFSIGIYVNGIQAYICPYKIETSTTSAFVTSIEVKSIPLKVGDLVTIRVYTDGSTASYNANAAANFFSIVRSGGY